MHERAPRVSYDPFGTCGKLTPTKSEVSQPPGPRPKGWVHVRFDIATDGTTTNIRVVDASPKDVLDERAIAVVKQVTFANVGGKDCDDTVVFR